MEINIVIDTEKLPEDERERILKELGLTQVKKEQDKPTGLFSVKTGTVIGNIYKDGMEKVI